MWPDIRELRTSIDASALICEVFVRVVILFITVFMRISIKPHMYYIKEANLLKNYKYPRQRSFVSPLATVVIIIVIPVLFFTPLYLTEDFVDLVQSFLAWSLALSINAFVTEFLKLATGRPRPDFFYRCFPDGVMRKEVYTGALKDILEGRKSFPSGHSSFAFCSLGFLSLWLCGRMGLAREREVTVNAFAVPIPLLLATIVAVSRCYDNHHHWEDVVFGSIFGLFITYLSYMRYYHPLMSEFSGCPYLLILETMGDNLSRTHSIVHGVYSIAGAISFS